MYRNGRASEALPLVKRRLARSAHSAWAQLEAALVYAKLGKRGLARKHLARSRKVGLLPDTQVEQFEGEVTKALSQPEARKR